MEGLNYPDDGVWLIGAEAVPSQSSYVLPAPPTEKMSRPGSSSLTAGPHPDISPAPSRAGPPSHRWRKRLLVAGAVVGLAAGGHFLAPGVETALNTVSTDDAYVNGHVTFVAPRVAGQVSAVLVDDNYRVKKGDLLVRLDPEPYQVQVAIKKAVIEAAQTDLAAAQAQVRGQVARAGPIASSSNTPSRTWITRSPISAPVWRLSTAEERPCNWRGPISNGARI